MRSAPRPSRSDHPGRPGNGGGEGSDPTVRVDEGFVGRLGQLVRPGEIVRVEGALGLGDQLPGPGRVSSGRGEDVRFPGGPWPAG